MKKVLFSALILALALSISACRNNSNNTVKGDVLSFDSLQSKTYVLTKIDGNSVSYGDVEPTITFTNDNRVSAKVCNTMNGAAVLNGNRLTVNQMVSTKMFCMNHELNELENAVAAMLSGGSDLRIDGDRLYIKYDGHEYEYRSVSDM